MSSGRAAELLAALPPVAQAVAGAIVGAAACELPGKEAAGQAAAVARASVLAALSSGSAAGDDKPIWDLRRSCWSWQS